MNLEEITVFLLNFSHAVVIAPLIVVGFLVIDRKIYGQGLCILVLSLFINSLLKSIFQIPLSPHLNKVGYAFPSGHMQASAVIYGWLLISSNSNLVRCSLSLLLIGIGYSLIQQKYHNLYDIIAGVFFAMVIVGACYSLSSTNLIRKIPSLLGILSLFIMILIQTYITKVNYKFATHLEFGIWGLTGFIVSWFCLNNYIVRRPHLAQGILAALYLAVTIIAIYFIFPKILSSESIYKWALLSSIMPIAACNRGKISNLKKIKHKIPKQKNLMKLAKEIIRHNID